MSLASRMQNLSSIKPLTFLFLLCLTGCGRKQKNLFNFTTKKSSLVKVGTLDLPSIKGIQVALNDDIINITWHSIKPEETVSLKDNLNNVIVVGYNVYSFTRGSFVPHKPVNQVPVQTSSFSHKPLQKISRLCYLVRGVYKINDCMLESPSSQIMCVK